MMRSVIRSLALFCACLALCAGVAMAQPDPDPGGTTTGDDTLLPCPPGIGGQHPGGTVPCNDGTGTPPRTDQQNYENPQIQPAFVYDQCLFERASFNGYINGPNPPGCTANDLTFTSVGRGVEGDPCITTAPSATDPIADTADLIIRAELLTTSSSQRYDVGFFVSTPLDPTPADGALTGNVAGACAFSRVPNPGREGLATCDQTAGTMINGVDYLDLQGTADDGLLTGSRGAYANFDNLNQMVPVNDLCSEIIEISAFSCDGPDAGTDPDRQFIDFDWDPVTVACIDTDNDGFINLGACASWSNQNTEVDGNDGDDFCESSWDIGAAGPSKCRCEFVNTTFTAPDLICRAPAGAPVVGGLEDQISCTVDLGGGPQDVSTAGPLPPNTTVTCSVEVSNDIVVANLADPTCVSAPIDADPILPDPDEERARCAHIGYVEWLVTVDDTTTTTDPTISFTPAPGVGTSSSDDSDFLDNPLDVGNNPIPNQLLWQTRSDSMDPLAGNLGVIPPGETTELTFSFDIPASTSNSRTINVSLEGFWHNEADFSDASPLTQAPITCTSTLQATPVSLAFARVRGFNDEQVLEWTTATEVSNVGFNVFADTREGRIRVNDDLIESTVINSTLPQRYSLDVSGVDSGRFWIEEVDADGVPRSHGPFRLGKTYGREPEIERIDWAGVRDVTSKRGGDRSGLRVGAAARKSQVESGSGGPAALLVPGDGIYRVTHEDLLAAGFDFGGVQADALALLSAGQPVPIRVLGPKAFGPGSAIEFFGEGIDSLYTADNVYVLANDRQSALRVGEEDAVPGEAPQPFVGATVVRENDVDYNPAAPIGDPWYESRILARGSRTRNYDFTVENLVAGGSPATVAVDVWGESQWSAPDDHHVIVSVNGYEIADVRWDGLAGRRIEATLSDGVLQEGVNTLTLTVPADNDSPWDLVNFDGFEVRYPAAPVVRDGKLLFTAEGGAYSVGGVAGGDLSVYRIGDQGPVLLTGLDLSGDQVTFATVPGTRYAVVSGGGAGVSGVASARTPTNLLQGPSFDYLVISHSSLLEGIQPLVDHHEANGLRVKVVDVEDVYASYSGGVVGAQPIQDFVRDAVQQKGVHYVLLVGGDTYDYKDHLGIGSVSLVPTPYAKTDNRVSYAPVDPLYGDLDGDLVPDVPVGRFPARTPEELDNLVAKTLEYTVKGYGQTAVFAADDFEGGVSFANDARRFSEALDSFSTRSAFLDIVGVDIARSTLIDAIDQGTALTVYFGHSGPTMWTFNSLFTVSDANALQNYGKPTVVVQFGCWNTYHVQPNFNTLGHAFLLAEDRGAAAVLGSSTLLGTISESLLANALGPKLVEPGKTLGDAVTEARQEIGAKSSFALDAILGWTILGDPAMTL